MAPAASEEDQMDQLHGLINGQAVDTQPLNDHVSAEISKALRLPPNTELDEMAPTASLCPTSPTTKLPRDTWYYPPDIANDMADVGLPEGFVQESLACSWEYARCVVPSY